MFSLFTALFGTAYYGTKIISERVEKAHSEQTTALFKNTVDRIYEQYTAPFDLIDECLEYVYSGRNYDDICSRFYMDFQHVLGNDWKSKLNIRKTPKSEWEITPNMIERSPKAFDHDSWVCHLYLASKGYLDSSVISFGYNLYTGEEDMYTICKFVHRLEIRLDQYHKTQIRFAFIGAGDRSYSPYNSKMMEHGKLVIREKCGYTTYKLWSDKNNNL